MTREPQGDCPCPVQTPYRWSRCIPRGFRSMEWSSYPDLGLVEVEQSVHWYAYDCVTCRRCIPLPMETAVTNVYSQPWTSVFYLHPPNFLRLVVERGKAWKKKWCCARQRATTWLPPCLRLSPVPRPRCSLRTRCQSVHLLLRAG